MLLLLSSCSYRLLHAPQEVFHPQRASLLLPYVFNSLYRNAQGHWNHNVETMSQSILKMYSDEDSVTYEQCLKKYQVRVAARFFGYIGTCLSHPSAVSCGCQEEAAARQTRQEATRSKWAAFAAQAPGGVKPFDGPVLPPPRPVIGIQETKLT